LVLFRPSGPFHRFCPVLCVLISRHLFCSLFLCLRVHFIRLIASVSLVAGPLTGRVFFVSLSVFGLFRGACSVHGGVGFPSATSGPFCWACFLSSAPCHRVCPVLCLGRFTPLVLALPRFGFGFAHNTFLLGLLDWFQFSPGFCPGLGGSFHGACYACSGRLFIGWLIEFCLRVHFNGFFVSRSFSRLGLFCCCLVLRPLVRFLHYLVLYSVLCIRSVSPSRPVSS
jgi:hypothetical protein